MGVMINGGGVSSGAGRHVLAVEFDVMLINNAHGVYSTIA